MQQGIISGILLTTFTLGAHASESEQEKLNYGDPTAVYSGLGITHGANDTQANIIVGFGNNVISADLSNKYKRGRFFHVTDSLGYSASFVDSKGARTATAGLIYKIPLTDHITLFPLANLGITSTYFGHKSSDGIANIGIYAAYQFDLGHWVYAQPKLNYDQRDRQVRFDAEIGAGYMLSDNVSVGSRFNINEKGSTLWLQANVYF